MDSRQAMDSCKSMPLGPLKEEEEAGESRMFGGFYG